MKYVKKCLQLNKKKTNRDGGGKIGWRQLKGINF